MAKLFVSNADITKQYVQTRLFCDVGNVAVAKDCKNVLKHYWDQLIMGRVDVEDIDHLYTKLWQCVLMITQAEAEAYDRMRDIKKRMKSGSAAMFHYDTY